MHEIRILRIGVDSIMEGISRANLDRISEILQNHVNTDESIKLAQILKDEDIIPKLYVYTYIKKVHDELDGLHSEDGFDQGELEALIENQDKLQLDVFNPNNRTEFNKLLKFLKNAFTREHQFCDFDDSVYHKATKIGSCENEYHLEINEEPIIPLTEKEQEEFDRIEAESDWNEAVEKFQKNFNPDNMVLRPAYYPDEETHKWDDKKIEWTCEHCMDNSENDGDFDVSCDMEDF